MDKNILEGKEWWEMLDWSTMESTFKELKPELQTKIKESGTWSLGVEKFEGD